MCDVRDVLFARCSGRSLTPDPNPDPNPSSSPNPDPDPYLGLALPLTLALPNPQVQRQAEQAAPCRRGVWTLSRVSNPIRWQSAGNRAHNAKSVRSNWCG